MAWQIINNKLPSSSPSNVGDGEVVARLKPGGSGSGGRCPFNAKTSF